MAKYTCPSCGKPYNGKVCRNCLYETFTEEITHGLHTHEGEPLVVETPERKPIRPKDPFGCEKKTRKPSFRLGIVIAVMLLALLGPILSAVFVLVSEVGNVVFGSTSEAKAEPALPAGGTTLYDADGLIVVADWQNGLEYEDGFYVVVQNNTGRNITVSSRDILVNGYLMEDSLLYCQADSGHSADDWFRLSRSDLDNAGIETVQELAFWLNIYDSDTYDTIAETEPVTLYADAGPDFVQPVDDSGTPLFEQDGIRILYRRYRPDEYYPEDFSEGSMLFYLENSTDRGIVLYTTDSYVNGTYVSLGLWCALPPHTRAVRSMYLYGLSSEKLDIESREDINSMTLELEIVDQEDYDVFLVTGPLSIPLEEGSR